VAGRNKPGGLGRNRACYARDPFAADHRGHVPSLRTSIGANRDGSRARSATYLRRVGTTRWPATRSGIPRIVHSSPTGDFRVDLDAQAFAPNRPAPAPGRPAGARGARQSSDQGELSTADAVPHRWRWWLSRTAPRQASGVVEVCSSYTGPAATGRRLRSHLRLIRQRLRGHVDRGLGRVSLVRA
jgi:hypothetical protein